jgi:hypothetical protein
MKNHYKVKFLNGGELHYGTVQTYTEESRKLASENKLLVEDAIYPECWVLEEKDISDVPTGRFDKDDEYWQFIKNFHDDVQAISDGIKGCAAGKLVKFQVADGYAYYIITKVNKTTVKLEWRGFSMDGYVEPVLGHEGTMDRKRLEKLIGFEDSLVQMFGEKS